MVIDRMLVMLMTIPLLDKTLELNIYQVHNLPAIPPGQEVEALYQLENDYFCHWKTWNVQSLYLQSSQLELACKLD